jgi:hypothetical protein
METTKAQKLAMYKDKINTETIIELQLFTNLENIKVNYNCGFISVSEYVNQCIEVLKATKKELI